jgi:hypothetical protein
MTPALRMAGLAADQLRFAELNEMWAYLEALLKLLKEMGARVVRLNDDRFPTIKRGDYIVSFDVSDTHPAQDGLLKVTLMHLFLIILGCDSSRSSSSGGTPSVNIKVARGSGTENPSSITSPLSIFDVPPEAPMARSRSGAPNEWSHLRCPPQGNPQDSYSLLRVTLGLFSII